MRFLRVALAFLRREILEEVSYRFAILLGIVGLIVSLFFIWVFAEFVGGMVAGKLDRYEGDYFAFVVLGIGLYSFLQATLFQLSRRIRQAQVVGTLEALLGTRTPLTTILLCMPLFPLLETSLYVLGILLLGSLFFGLPMDPSGLPAVLAALPFTLAAFGGLGLVGAGLTVAFKRAEAVPFFLSNLSLFLGGVWYPVDALPGWLRSFAALLPLTHALEVLRRGLLAGAGLRECAPSILALAANAALLLPAGFLVLRWSVRRAMRDGSLTQY